MIYVYDIDELEKNTSDILTNGLGVAVADVKILSKMEKLVVNGQLIKCSYISLEEYIRCFDTEQNFQIIDGVQIQCENVLDLLCEELYHPRNDGITIADRIYNAANPQKEIEKLINEFLLTVINLKIEDMIVRAKAIEKQILNGEFQW